MALRFCSKGLISPAFLRHQCLKVAPLRPNVFGHNWCRLASSASSELVQHLEVQGDSFPPRVRIPLSTAGVREFSLSPDKTINSLLSELREEDKNLKDVCILSSEGVQVAGSTQLADVLKDSFQLQLDNQRYSVKPSTALVFRSRDSLPLGQYLRLCEKVGMPDMEARTLSRYLHNLNLILDLDSDKNASGYNKSDVMAALQRALVLHGQYTETETHDLEQQLANLKAKLEPIEKLKAELDQKAVRSANLWTLGGLSVLMGQFGAIYYGTYILYSWDVMEPITYLLGLANVIGGFTFFTLVKREYAFDTAYGMLVKRKQKKLYQRNGLNLIDIKTMENSVKDLEHRLQERSHQLSLLK